MWSAKKKLRITDNTFALGDPLAIAFIGWESGHFHWKLTSMVNFPVLGQLEFGRRLVRRGREIWVKVDTGWVGATVSRQIARYQPIVLRPYAQEYRI